MDGHSEGYNREGKVDEPAASVGEDVKNSGESVGQARCGKTWMRWNDSEETHRLHSTGYLKHLEPRAHHEKKCVCCTWQMRAVRCAVYTCAHSRNTTAASMDTDKHAVTGKELIGIQTSM